ncbi:flavodoxin-dependent (E)-4-hydroxy-3-methylbut-2-enyl-diphosphate synthase [uncultured Traorella sp.]|uniref:flavodoxin-dependent (E)-4-hydroxy-3-methylbut-2-enyl-diphosphate synthase n=1 Tax=uncultured Traorella sp. TaxID=1929048 RepID=UPI0025D319C3|nr:flavodoxin-dependent (E)-4-hydroxy-3-methylbut-2-enyl-diphosphate synthase [uncultured Traorella sp.]
MTTRSETRAIMVNDLQIGHQNKVIIQSMCNTKTSDIEATVKQILALEKAGCQLVRLAVVSIDEAKAISEIKKRVHIPLVADIHYDYRIAIECIHQGIDKIRLNPGNIGSKENVRKVVNECKKYHIPIRIGINAGSLEKDIHDKYGRPTAQGMIESAQRHVNILEELDFHDIALSFKSSDVNLCIETYELASKTFDYPLHLGVTEAGTVFTSSIKSSAALSVLLHQGIGDTIRISVNGDPVQEIMIAKQLLKCLHLIDHVPNLIACPMCGRTSYDIESVIKEIEPFLMNINADINVAIMGCAVNGPGEARHADIAIAGGKDEGLLIKKGKIIEKLPTEKMADRLKEEILKMTASKDEA